MQTPLLILSDAITSSTGLARIARDLSTRIHANLQDVYRVGVLGVGGPLSTSSRFPFPNYSIRQLDQMCPIDLPLVWQDFAGQYGDGQQEDSAEDLQHRTGQMRKGVLFVIWNASWCQWLAQPHLLPDAHPLASFLLQRPPSIPAATWAACTPALRASLAQRPFSRWLYCPVDGHCTDGTLGWQMAPILEGFERVLAYTRYGANVIESTLAKWGSPGLRFDKPVPDLPHGLDLSVFHPRDRALARQTMVSRLSNGDKSLPLKEDQELLAVVATNTSRKDWGLAFQTCGELLQRGRNVFLFGHTDTLVAHWNIPAMAKQFGMDRRVMITTDRLSDDDMAYAYSAADVMLAIGSEGWGLPASEALGCGLPVVHMTYAGGADFTPACLQVEPIGHHLESGYMIQRPVFSPSDWADKIEMVLKGSREELSKFPDRIVWSNAWKEWTKWLTQDIQ